MDNPIIIVLIVLGFAVLCMAVMLPFVLRMSRERLRAKAEKREHKLAEKRTDTELEIAKTKASFEIEKERAAITPQFCRYCGAKHEASAKNCSSCGSSLR